MSLVAILRRVLTPPRIQAFEFCDQSWLSGVWREAYLDGLNFLFRAGGVYRRLHLPFSAWATEAGQRQVLDLASGGGGPIRTVVENASRDGVKLPVITLSDLLPDTALREAGAVRSEAVHYFGRPVDATAPLPDGTQLASICTAFHHFPPRVAREVLANMHRQSEGLFIAEFSVRSWLAALAPLLSLLPLMLSSFFSGRCSFRKVLITAVFPIVPLMVIFDGMVSVLRVYTREEILAMMPGPMRRRWRWTWGEQRYLGLFRATYICGYRGATGRARSGRGACVSAGLANAGAPPALRRPWAVDRWGRLLAGMSVGVFTALGMLHHPAWLWATLAISFNLIFSSLTDFCPLNKLLLRLGAHEREDLFLPGGELSGESRVPTHLDAAGAPQGLEEIAVLSER